jgi:hypothetical protein
MRHALTFYALRFTGVADAACLAVEIAVQAAPMLFSE